MKDTDMTWPEPTTEEPSEETLRSWAMDVDQPEATDGCIIEPDGTCEHGHPCWMLYLGLI